MSHQRHAQNAQNQAQGAALEVTDTERQLAKAVNFGLLFGQSARGLRRYAASTYGVTMTLLEAKRYKANWFATYVGITDWHQRIEIDAYRRMLVRTPAGREQRFTATTYRHTRVYNTPVQGGAAEVMLAALNRLPGATVGLDACLVAVVHDETILEAKTADVLSAKKVLEETMVAGMLDIFPGAATTGLVEVRTGKSWADKKG